MYLLEMWWFLMHVIPSYVLCWDIIFQMKKVEKTANFVFTITVFLSSSVLREKILGEI